MAYQQLLPMGDEGSRDNRELSNITSFVKAGKAVFTILNEKTGNRFTYRVKRHKENKSLYFVSVLSGSDNVSDYTYIGAIFGNKFRTTKGSRVKSTAPSFVAFAWFLRNIKNLPEVIKVFHENRCGRCGRALTVPESVSNGFGPECIKKVR
jgi:hypothetical protein